MKTTKARLISIVRGMAFDAASKLAAARRHRNTPAPDRDPIAAALLYEIYETSTNDARSQLTYLRQDLDELDWRNPANLDDMQTVIGIVRHVMRVNPVATKRSPALELAA